MASVSERKIFDLVENGTGVTGIIRRSNELIGKIANGTDDWNCHPVKYILIMRGYLNKAKKSEVQRKAMKRW